MRTRYLSWRRVPLAVVEWHPALLFAFEAVDRVFRRHIGRDAVLTAAQEDAHGEGSLHFGVEGDPRCRAADFSFDGVPDNKKIAISSELRRRLGEDFDVVVEADHFHVEYDPED